MNIGFPLYLLLKVAKNIVGLNFNILEKLLDCRQGLHAASHLPWVSHSVLWRQGSEESCTSWRSWSLAHDQLLNRLEIKIQMRWISNSKMGRVRGHNTPLPQHELNVVEHRGIMVYKVIYDNEIWNLQHTIHRRFSTFPFHSSVQLHSTIISLFSLSL